MSPGRIATRLLTIVVVTCSLHQALADDPQSSAAFWLSLDRSAQSAYVLGFKGGAGHGSVTATSFWREAGYFKKAPSSNEWNRLAKQIQWDIAIPPLIDGMTALYQDPGNVYVNEADALLITLSRLQGHDVEKQLREARRLGLLIHQKTKSEN